MAINQTTKNYPVTEQKPGKLYTWQWWSGPILTIIAAIIIAAFVFSIDYRVPITGGIFVLIVAYAAFMGGLFSSLVSAGLIIFYFVLELLTPLGALNRNFDNAFRLLIITIIAPATAWMVSGLKSRAENSIQEKLKLEQEYSLELKNTLERQQQAEEEVRRLNFDLEERVKERTAQLQLREELSRKQQRQFQAILDYSSATISLKDLEGRYLLVNKRVENLFGLHRASIIGKSSKELFPTGNHKQWNSNDNQVLLTGQTLETEQQFEREDGWHTFFSVKFPVRDETGKIFAIGGISTDITERKRLELEAQKLVSLVENSTEFFGIADLEGNLEYLNEAGLKLLGVESLEQLKGHPIGEIYSQQRPYLYELDSDEDLMTKEQKRGEFQFRNFATGETIPVFSNIFVIKDSKTGQPLGIAHVASDLREAKQAQEAALESQVYLSGIIEASMDAIITANSNREIVTFNRAAEKLFGVPASQALGQPPDRFIPERLSKTYIEYFAQNDINDEKTRNAQFANPLYAIGAGGKEIPIEATISRVKKGDETFATVFVRDITDSQNVFNRLEERVNQRTAELSVLLDISQNVAADFTLQSVKDLLASQLGQLMKYQYFVLYRLQKDGSFTVIGGQSALNDSSLQEFTSRLHDFSPGHAQAVKTKTSIIINDVCNDSPREFIDYLRKYNVDETKIRSAMYIPLILKDEVEGLFSITCTEPGYYTPYHARLAQAIGYQVAVALGNIRLYEQAQLLAALEERQRLARELHDSTSQVLYSLQLGLRALGNFLQRDQLKETNDTLAYLIGLAKGGLDEMRLLIFELRPESLEREGLLRALQKQIVALEGRHNLKVKVSFQPDTEPDMPLEYKEAIYRIAREALHNIVKHAKTEQVDLHLICNDRFFQLVIKDYGQGFNIKEEFPGHYGLNSMEERVQNLPGAQLKIESEPGLGTEVSLKVPLPSTSLV